MANFIYTAKNKQGRIVEGSIDDLDLDSAVASLQSKDLVVLSIKKEGKKTAAGRTRQKRLRRRVTADDLTLFAGQMHALLEAGVPLLKVLDIMTRQVEAKPLVFALQQVHKDIEGGASLHESIAKHPRVFSSLWSNLIQTGETSGQLGPVFLQLGKYLERSSSIQKRIRSALIYPAILLVVCIIAILVFTLKIIPMFGEIYAGFDIRLPALTNFVLQLSLFMRRYFILVIGLGVGGVFAFKRYAATEGGKLTIDTISLRVPVFGRLVEGIIIERFAQGLKTLITSGIPILLSLDIVGRLIGNKAVELTLEDVKQQVRNGKTMAGPMEKSGMFPPVVTQMINVGEETGKLTEMLDKIAAHYEERMTFFVDRFTAVFEPALLIFMGLTVGVLVVAMYLPIFKIATSAT